MSTVEHAPLGGFEKRLLLELRVQVASQPVVDWAWERPATRGQRVMRWLRSGWLLPGCAAVTSVVVALLSLLPTAQPALARAFPIVNGHARALPEYLRRVLDQQTLARVGAPSSYHAYTFRSPTGTGYVVVGKREKWLCVLVPGLAVHSGAVHCETSTELLAPGAPGIRLVVADSDREELVELLPKGGTVTSTEADVVRGLPLSGGVLAIMVDKPLTITTDVNGHRSTLTYRLGGRNVADRQR